MKSTTIISEGADPLRPAWCHLTESRSSRASPEIVWLLPVSGSPDPRFPPYVVRPLRAHGAPAYGRYLTGGFKVAAGASK